MVITVAKTSTLPGGGGGGGPGGGPEVATLLGSPEPCMRHRIPASRIFAVVLVTLRDSVLEVGVTRQTKLRSLAYCISGLVVEYIVAIDVTWVRFPADAEAKLATLVHEVTE